MSRERHIMVIDPATRVAELDCFNTMTALTSLRLTYHLPAMHGMDTLRTDYGPIAGIVVLGSGASVYDRAPWQMAFEDWLLPLLTAGIPTFGICYGHQMLAYLFGGKVAFMFPDHHKLQGFREITLESNRFWSTPRRGRVVVSHREAVVTCPTSMQIAGHSPEVGIEALAHETLPIFSIQAHPEATLGFMANQNLPAPSHALAFGFGHDIVKAFLAFCEAQS